jgi:TonB family protein
MRVAIGAAALVFFSSVCLAQDVDLPKVHVLSCETGCSKWTRPKPIGEHKSYFPVGERMAFPQYRAEAFAVIRFTITPDGTVSDPILEKLVGPQAFADNALEAVKTWRYEPATENGVPVAVNWRAEVAYYFKPRVDGARAETYGAYRHAKALIEEKKFTEADAVLLAALDAPRLNFYEREMLSLLAAVSYSAQGDYLTARDYAEDATLFDAKFLDRAGQEAAMRQRVKLETVTGQFAEALEWYEKLKKNVSITADDPEAKMIAWMTARLNDPKPITIDARIAPGGYPNTWSHSLLRRHFRFPQADAGTDRFVLACDRNKIESRVSTEAEWHVPKSWSNCRLLVHGTAGAKFQLQEAVE